MTKEVIERGPTSYFSGNYQTFCGSRWLDCSSDVPEKLTGRLLLRTSPYHKMLALFLNEGTIVGTDVDRGHSAGLHTQGSMFGELASCLKAAPLSVPSPALLG